MTKRKNNDLAFEALLAKDAPAPKPAAPVKSAAKSASITAAQLSQFVDTLTAVGAAITAAQRQLADVQKPAPPQITTQQVNQKEVVAAIDKMTESVTQLLKQSIKVQSADRVITNDEFDRPRSKIII